MSYEERSAEFGFVSKDQILETLKNPKAVLLDVRSPAEIQVGGEITGYNSVQSDCTPAMCPTLSTEPEKLVPDKDAPVIVYCRSGRRAARAKQTLEEKGYANVMNAGGYDDIKGFLPHTN